VEFEIVESFTYDIPSVKKDGEELVCSIEAHSYIWQKDGRVISGQESQRFTPVEDGTYTVIAVNDAGCNSAESEEFEITVGINENHNDISYLNIYPNPNDGFITVDIELKGSFESNISVIDLNGDLVYEEQNLILSNTVNKHVNISHLPTGIYFMRIDIGQNSYIKKIIRK
jgi:hypothetical protein